MGLKEDFQNLSPSKCLLAGLVLAAAYYFLMFDSGKGIDDQEQIFKTEIAATEKRLNEAQDALDNKANYEKKAKAITKELEELLKYFPTNLNMSDFQKQITTNLKKTNNRLAKMQDEEVIGRFPGYVEQGTKIEALGGFHEIMDFLASLTQIERMVDLKTLAFENAGSNEDLSIVKMSLLLTVFSYDAAAEKSAEAGK